MRWVILAFLLSSDAFADSSVYRPKKMNCDELRETLENYKVITVRYGLLNISTYSVFQDSGDAQRRCGFGAREANFRTRDRFSCLAGYICEQQSSGFPGGH